MLIEKANEDVASFVIPKYSSTSSRLIISSPEVVLLEITTQLLPAEHKEVHTKLAPDPEEVYPGKQTHTPAFNDAPIGHDEDVEIRNPKKNINLHAQSNVLIKLFSFPFHNSPDTWSDILITMSFKHAFELMPPIL